MKPGLTFFDFLRHRAFDWDNPGSTEWANMFLTHIVDDTMKVDGHSGDCTKQPYTCDLCLMEDMLSEYRQYRFNYDEYVKSQEE